MKTSLWQYSDHRRSEYKHPLFYLVSQSRGQVRVLENLEAILAAGTIAHPYIAQFVLTLLQLRAIPLSS